MQVVDESKNWLSVISEENEQAHRLGLGDTVVLTMSSESDNQLGATVAATVVEVFKVTCIL